MSDQTAQPTPDARISAANGGTSSKARTRQASTKRIAHDKVIEAYANAHPKDPTAKGLRRVLRANKDADPAYKAHVKNTPWCAHRRAVLQRLFRDDAAFLKALGKVR